MECEVNTQKSDQQQNVFSSAVTRITFLIRSMPNRIHAQTNHRVVKEKLFVYICNLKINHLQGDFDVFATEKTETKVGFLEFK